MRNAWIQAIALFFVLLISTTHGHANPSAAGRLYNLALRAAAKSPQQARALFVEACKEGASAACARVEPQRELKSLETSRLPVLQGATDATTTQIAVLITKNQPLHATLWEGEALRPSLRPTLTGRSFSNQQVLNLAWQGLNPNREYQLEIADANGRLLDRRQFSTLDTRPRKARIAIISCMNDKHAQGLSGMWDDLAAKQPDLLMLIGDNVYADRYGTPATPQRLWNRYVETRQRLRLFKWPRLIPSVAVWDDHDFGQNNGDYRFPFKEESRNVFETFFPQNGELRATERGPGVSSYFRFFGQAFFLMDGRSFRSEPGRDGIKTKWGEVQTQWMLDRSEKLQEPIWLVTGDQFFGGYHKYESFEKDHPEDFQRLLTALSRRFPVLFVSGDRHLSEIMDIREPVLGYRTLELTSSGIHTSSGTPPSPSSRTGQKQKGSPQPRNNEQNPRRLHGPYYKNNYMVVETTPPSLSQANAWQLDVVVFGPENEVGFKDRFLIQR